MGDKARQHEAMTSQIISPRILLPLSQNICCYHIALTGGTLCINACDRVIMHIAGPIIVHAVPNRMWVVRSVFYGSGYPDMSQHYVEVLETSLNIRVEPVNIQTSESHFGVNRYVKDGLAYPRNTSSARIFRGPS
jgi:hypothetical protein